MNLADVVQFLLDLCVDVQMPDLYGKTACDIAQTLEHENILQMLHDHINSIQCNKNL